MLMRYVAAIAGLLICGLAAAEDNLEPLHAFVRINKPEHFYAIRKQAADLIEADTHRHLGAIGLISTEGGPGLIRLQRVTRRGYHVLYTKLPRGARLPADAKLDPWSCWVWEEPAPGLVPVYGCSMPDGRDTIYSTDPEAITQAIDTTKRALNVKRKNLGLVFYVKPLPAADDPLPADKTD